MVFLYSARTYGFGENHSADTNKHAVQKKEGTEKEKKERSGVTFM